MARTSARLVAWALVSAGAAFFCARLGVLDSSWGRIALAGAALVVLFHLARTVDPAWLLTAGILSTMFAGHWADLGLGASLAPHRIVLAAGLLSVLLRSPPARDRPTLSMSRVHLALAVALAYVVISAMFAGTLDVAESQVVLFDQYGLLPFGMFLIAPAAFSTERQRMILLGGLVAAGGYLAVTAMIEQLEVYDLLVPGYIGDPAVGLHFGRARGPFAESAHNGLALFMCTVAAAIALVLWRRPVHRILAGLVLVLAPVGLLLTVTRGPWLAGVAGTLVVFATTAGLRRFLVPVAVAGVLGVFVAFALIPGVAEEAETRENDKSPVYERQNTTAAGLRMIAERPITGFGWWFENSEMQPYYRLHPDIPLTGAAAGLHNTYLQYGVALGLVGLGLWLVAVAMAIGGALTTRGPPSVVPWQIGLKGVFVAWLIVGLFSPGNYAFATALVWTWAGVVWTHRPNAPAFPETAMTRRPVVAGPTSQPVG